MNFEPYPFEKLRDLIAQLKTKENQEIISLTIGEPQFETPEFIQRALKKHTALLNKYPKSAGESCLRESQRAFVKNRYEISLHDSEIIPTFGTREVLFNLPQYLLFNKKNPTIAHPNPFYQIYEGAAIASRARTFYMDLNEENNFTPSLSKEQMKETHVVILNSPNNPTGATLSLDALVKWVEHALEFDFILINDECYGDIYEENPPYSILEACIKAGNTNFKNVLALNSISKRSSAPGLRSGFIAGDAEILKGYAKYRTYAGCAIPLPLQEAASKAWDETKESEKIRKKYAKNLALARKILGVNIEPYTFYVWLKVGDDLEFTKRLYENDGILVLPGSFLGRDGAGSGYVRLALVYEPKILKKALKKVAKCLI
ncbi:MAG: succinyldiaminopimelate transaminase [Wolinella sp.]